MSSSGGLHLRSPIPKDVAGAVGAKAPEGWDVWIAKGLDSHPLKGWVAQV